MRSRGRSKRPVFAKRSLGQNFLVDDNFIRKIVAALGNTEEDLVVEVGPGRGALTEKLIGKCRKFIGIELDTNLAELLDARYGNREEVEIVEFDILAADVEKIVGSHEDCTSVKLVANLPYNISTPVLEKLSGLTSLISASVLMLQKEVVARITAKPGQKERGFLTVCTEAFFQSEFLFDVPPTAFRPAPKVWSSVVRLTPNVNDSINDPALFRKLVSSGFMQKRKTILNNLKAAGFVDEPARLLLANSVDYRLRPEALTLANWVDLSNALSLE